MDIIEMQLDTALTRADTALNHIGSLIEGATEEAIPDEDIRNNLVSTLHLLANNISVASAFVLEMIESKDGERVERAHQLLCRHLETTSKALPLVEESIT